jgi:hypothetical protein
MAGNYGKTTVRGCGQYQRFVSMHYSQNITLLRQYFRNFECLGWLKSFSTNPYFLEEQTVVAKSRIAEE